jgi:hypothetical protein
MQQKILKWGFQISPNNRLDLSNPLARNLQEQQSKLRAKPSLRSGTDLQVKRMLGRRFAQIKYLREGEYYQSI